MTTKIELNEQNLKTIYRTLAEACDDVIVGEKPAATMLVHVANVLSALAIVENDYDVNGDGGVVDCYNALLAEMN